MEAIHPEQLGRYDLIRVRGSGAMGRVYEGFDPVLNRQVAIKTIRLDHLGEDIRAEFLARFRIEAHAAGRLHSPNIISIYDAGLEGSVAYLVMELIDGKDLREILAANGPVGLGAALHVMRDVLGALETAHAHRIVHRDVKPGNVLIDVTGAAKLGDFGAARILNSGDATLTGSSVIGTLKYMSPEQLRGDPIDARVDIYAAGILLYEMLTRKKPFDGENDFQVCQSILNSDPAPASSIVSTVPDTIDRFIQRAIAKEPEERFASAAEFSRELTTAFPALSESTALVSLGIVTGSETTQPTVWADRGSSGKSRQSSKSSWERSADGRSPDPSALDGVLRESELVYWKDVKDSTEPDDLRGFLAIFPRGIYAELAKRKLGRLTTDTGSLRPMTEATPEAERSRVDETLFDRRKSEAPRGLETERRDRERQNALHASLKAEERRIQEESEQAELERQAMLEAEREAQERRPAEEARVAELARQEAERQARLKAEQEAEERHQREEAERKEREADSKELERHAMLKAVGMEHCAVDDHASTAVRPRPIEVTSRRPPATRRNRFVTAVVASFAIIGISLTLFRAPTHPGTASIQNGGHDGVSARTGIAPAQDRRTSSKLETRPESDPFAELRRRRSDGAPTAIVPEQGGPRVPNSGLDAKTTDAASGANGVVPSKLAAAHGAEVKKEAKTSRAELRPEPYRPMTAPTKPQVQGQEQTRAARNERDNGPSGRGEPQAASRTDPGSPDAGKPVQHQAEPARLEQDRGEAARVEQKRPDRASEENGRVDRQPTVDPQPSEAAKPESGRAATTPPSAASSTRRPPRATPIPTL